MNKTYYFDYASATPVDSDIVEKMEQLSAPWANISARHSHGVTSRKIWSEALVSIAGTLNTKPSEIVITSGGTESNNLAIHAVMQGDKNAEVLISAFEHQSVKEKSQQYNCREILVDAKGVLNIDDLKTKITDQTKLISVMQVNNEIGTIQPLREVAEIVNKVRKDRQARGIKMPLYLHSDSCQATNYLSVLPNRLGVDMMTINSCKMYGPKGVGLLYVSSKIKSFEPLIVGGGQQNNRRGGTEDVANTYGLALALKKANDLRKTEEMRVSKLRDKLISDIQKGFPDAVINGSLSKRIANNISVSFPGVDNETLMFQLDEQGVSVGTGSACSAGSQEPSYSLTAIGADKDLINSTLRITLGRQTDESSIDYLYSCIKTALK